MDQWTIERMTDMNHLWKKLLGAAAVMTLLSACGQENEIPESIDETEEVEEKVETPVEEESEEVGDQIDLKIGDTGTFETTLGTYEMTLDGAEIVGTELDGEESLFDELIVLDLTIKNTGDDAFLIEEVMHDMEITEDMETSGSSNGAEMFDSIEMYEGELQPGEERSGQFIGDIYTGNEYYFKKAEGNVAAGTSNQVLWTIQDSEARPE